MMVDLIRCFVTNLRSSKEHGERIKDTLKLGKYKQLYIKYRVICHLKDSQGTHKLFYNKTLTSHYRYVVQTISIKI